MNRWNTSATVVLVALAFVPPSQPALSSTAAIAGDVRISISFPAERNKTPIDGRVLLVISTDNSTEPRFQVSEDPSTAQIFGIDVEGLKPGENAVIAGDILGYPRKSLRDVPAGDYWVQAVLHRYETFHRADGHVVKLPMDRGEGQHWNLAPGNLYSKPVQMTISSDESETIAINLDQEIPPVEPPKDTKYIKHVRIQSKKLSEFWGRPMHLGACVLLPEGFETHPDARYPLIVFHGHFPATFANFREMPPDPNLKPEYSERFKWPQYNRTVQEHAYKFFQDWTAPDFPRFVIIEIQHANPFYGHLAGSQFTGRCRRLSQADLGQVDGGD